MSRRWYRSRAVIIGLAIIAAFSALLILVAHTVADRRQMAVMENRATDAAASEIAILADGNVVFAPNGTVARQLTDWLESNDGQPRVFEVGGEQFSDDRIEPTVGAQARLPTLVMLMRAYPRVDLELIGHPRNRPDAMAEQRLARERAEWLNRYLVRAGISAKRVTSAAAGSDKSSATDAINGGRAGRVTLRLTPN